MCNRKEEDERSRECAIKKRKRNQENIMAGFGIHQQIKSTTIQKVLKWQPIPPPKKTEDCINYAAMSPKVIWMEILSFTHCKCKLFISTPFQ